MRQLFLRLAVAPGLLALACATAIEEGIEPSPLDGEGGTSNGGSLIASGTGGGNSSSGSTSMSNGGKSGSSTGAFGGTTTAGSTGEGGKAGSATGGSGGKGGSGGSATAGSSAGGKGGTGGTGGSGTAGTGGSSAGGPGSTTCAGVPDWSATTYKIGDTVASTCSGVFAGACPPGQSHKFECNPAAGVPALPWCTSREPGVGNGWAEAWVDKGQCQ